MSARLDAFFGPPNSARPAELPPTAAQLLDDLGARLDRVPCRTLLPARVGDDIRWYAIASDGRQSRLLLEEVRSWLGPPIAKPASMVVVPTDEVDERALELLSGGVVARVDVATGWRQHARANVERLVTTWSLTPERNVAFPRPVGRVLRQFYDALLARDRSSAESALREVQDRSLLSAGNTRFLRVELLAALGTSVELRDDPELQGITLLARPSRVTDLLAVAADELIVRPAFMVDDPDARQAAKDLEDQWPGLVTHPAQVVSVAGARCLALVEAAADEPRASVLTAIRTIWGHDPIVLRVLGEDSSSETPPGRHPIAPTEPDRAAGSGRPDRSQDPRRLVDLGEYVAAIEMVEEAPPDAALAAVAMYAALNLGEATYDERALHLVDRLDETARAELLTHAVERSFHEQLVDRTGAAEVPERWSEWLKGVGSDRPDLLRSWCTRWGEPADLGEPEVDALVLSLIEALSGDRRARTRNGLPVLLDWIVGDEGLGPATVRLALLAVDVMLDFEPGPLERQGILELIGELLDQGCSASEYDDLTKAIEGHLPSLGPRDAGWMAGCIDLLWLYSCPDRPARASLTSQAFACTLGWADRVAPLDRIVLRRVFAQGGFELEELQTETADVADVGGEAPSPRGFRSVGIYSLHEAASRTASAWIRDEWPGVTVRESHDLVNSDRLEALVKGCDVVLVQTSRASHAATGAIAAVAVDPSRIVFVNGRGASSILRGLNQWVWGDG